MEIVLVNAASARAGGGLRFAEDLLPRLAARLSDHGVGMSQLAASDVASRNPIARRLEVDLRGRRPAQRAGLVLNVGNSALTASAAPQWTMVRNRLLVDRPRVVPWGATERLWQAALVHALVKSERWIVPSSTMATLLEAFSVRTRLPRRPISVVPHGVDPTRFQPRPGRRRDVLYPAVPARHKNFGTLLRAMDGVARQHDGVRLTLTVTRRELLSVTDWRPAGGEWPRWLECAGRVDAAAAPQLFGLHSVLAYPSICESFGIPLLEARAAGLRIVASDLDVFREMAPQDAALVPPHDHERWEAEISQAIDRGPTAPDGDTLRTWDDAADEYAALILARVRPGDGRW